MEVFLLKLLHKVSPSLAPSLTKFTFTFFAFKKSITCSRDACQHDKL